MVATMSSRILARVTGAAHASPDGAHDGVDDRACWHHGCVAAPDPTVLTLASGVTLLRAAVSLAAITASIATGRAALLFVGLGVHCVGDVADGYLARRRDEETRAGAVLDVVCDRLAVCLYYVAYGELHVGLLVPIAVFLFEFMVLDAYLSLAFLSWPLRSLNYFWLVDRTVYRWNWSPVAKASNSGALVVLMLVTGSLWACLAMAVGLTVVKTASIVRLSRRGVPAPTGCAAVPR